MNILIFCVFSLVPFQNAAVHEANVTVCPDYANILRFENDLALPKMLYPMEEAEPLPEGNGTPKLPELPTAQEGMSETLSEAENLSKSESGQIGENLSKLESGQIGGNFLESESDQVGEALPEPILAEKGPMMVKTETEAEKNQGIRSEIKKELSSEIKTEKKTEQKEETPALTAFEPEIVPEIVPEMASEKKAEGNAELKKTEMVAETEQKPELESRVRSEMKPGRGEYEKSYQDPYWAAKPETSQEMVQQEPERLVMPNQATVIPTQVPETIPGQGTGQVLGQNSGRNSVALVTAQEPMMGNVPGIMAETVAGTGTVTAENGTLNDEPIRRPWGVLTFCVFILLLSVSANVFLGWQLIEMRNAKLK